MVELLRRIKEVLLDFLRWFWNKLRPPNRKSWCGVFYFVAQETNISMPNPELGDLDHKLKDAIKALKRARFDKRQVHVVYRAIWLDESTPVARVVGPILSPQTDYFPGCSKTTSTPLATEEDLPCFLKWVYKWCPADHYAVFFWGHSFGPAGLFAPGGDIDIPPPLGLASLKAAFEEFSTLRASGQAPGAVSTEIVRPGPAGSLAITGTGGGGGAAAGDDDRSDTEIIEEWAAANPKIEVVLFQDCWMSTLETAYELAHVAQYVIASQSLVPIGLAHKKFLWPYKQLLDDLLSANYARDLAGHIELFYQSNFNKIPTLRSVPIALLDLAGVAGITKPLENLTKSLKSLTPQARGNLIRKGRILDPYPWSSSSELTAGDAALIDVPLMCKAMLTYGDQDIHDAADSLKLALATLIVSNKEALPRGRGPLGFGGISVLYWPPHEPEDTYITDQLDRASYENLKFQSTASFPNHRWPALEHRT